LAKYADMHSADCRPVNHAPTSRETFIVLVQKDNLQDKTGAFQMSTSCQGTEQISGKVKGNRNFASDIGP